MSRNFKRYALYFLAENGSDLATFGESWLGWSIDHGRPVPHETAPAIESLPLPLEEITRTPRKYGFHGTLKAPFRLAEGYGEPELIEAATSLAATIPVFTIDAFKLASIGRFIALVPDGKCPPLDAMATRLVRELDHFRAPLGTVELERRRANGLTAEQDALLLRWGYPYVMQEFRFHMTLTGPLEAEHQAEISDLLRHHLEGVVGVPVTIRNIGLVGEAEDGHFHLIHRLPLAA